MNIVAPVKVSILATISPQLLEDIKEKIDRIHMIKGELSITSHEYTGKWVTATLDIGEQWLDQHGQDQCRAYLTGVVTGILVCAGVETT